MAGNLHDEIAADAKRLQFLTRIEEVRALGRPSSVRRMPRPHSERPRHSSPTARTRSSAPSASASRPSSPSSKVASRRSSIWNADRGLFRAAPRRARGDGAPHAREHAVQAQDRAAEDGEALSRGLRRRSTQIMSSSPTRFRADMLKSAGADHLEESPRRSTLPAAGTRSSAASSAPAAWVKAGRARSGRRSTYATAVSWR